MSRLTAQAGTAQLKFEGTVNESATVTIAGKPATVTGSGAFVGSAAVTNGTNTISITATDASGNSRTQEYEVEVTNAGGTFSYDANGNLTTRGTRTYSWDAENRLVQVADDGTPIASFTYDGFGRRASKTAGGSTHNFVYDRSDILEDRISGGATTRHVHGPAIDQPLASVTSGTATYYLADHLGSIVQTTNASEAVTLTRQYDPYGNLLQGDTTSGYAFTGREWDAEIGLYYYRARYYDPSVGRFSSADPIGLNGGVNPYAYVSDSPTNLVDPYGLKPGDWWDPRSYDFSRYNPWDTLKDIGTAAEAVADALTFGSASRLNDALGNSQSVDRCGIGHKLGSVAGVLISTTIGASVGAAAAEANAGKKGFEFSHWIPDRMGGPRSVYNGNHVSQKLHYLTDPYRYPTGYQQFGPKLPGAVQQLLRVPWVYDGAAAGAGYGAAGTSAGCGCR